jgi:hypothetical protein
MQIETASELIDLSDIQETDASARCAEKLVSRVSSCCQKSEMFAYHDCIGALKAGVGYVRSKRQQKLFLRPPLDPLSSRNAQWGSCARGTCFCRMRGKKPTWQGFAASLGKGARSGATRARVACCGGLIPWTKLHPQAATRQKLRGWAPLEPCNRRLSRPRVMLKPRMREDVVSS